MKFATSINSLLLLASTASACLYKRAETKGPQWSYGGVTGPLQWHHLDPSFEKCASGTNQSPIDIEIGASTTKEIANIQMKYPKKGDFEIFNNGHTLELTPLEYGETPDYTKSNYTTVLEGDEFKLMQFHFHTPSEHRLNGMSYPLEVHFVHVCPETKKNAVVGIFFDIAYGPSNDFCQKLAPVPTRFTSGGISDVKEKDQSAELKGLPLKKIQEHLAAHPAYHYSGSLTTPPCSEEIKWYVSKEPLKLDVGEFLRFKEIMKFNSRFTQNNPGEPNLLAAGAACPSAPVTSTPEPVTSESPFSITAMVEEVIEDIKDTKDIPTENGSDSDSDDEEDY